MTAQPLDLAITEPGVYPGVPFDAYLADPVAAGSLSRSGALKLLPPYTPAHYDYERRNPVEEHSDTFDLGKAVHKLVLDDLAQEVVVIDAGNWRTKAAQEARDAARAAGKIPVLPEQYAVAEAMAEAVRAHPTASRLFAPDSGRAEQTLVWRDPDTRIWCRCRVDWLPHKVPGRRMILPDLKTARSANPREFATTTARNRYGYELQAFWYLDGVQQLGLDDDPAFVFVIVEKAPPHLVSIVEFDPTSQNVGRTAAYAARHVYRECVDTGRWPGYGDDVHTVSLPEWYLKQHGEEPES